MNSPLFKPSIWPPWGGSGCEGHRTAKAGDPDAQYYLSRALSFCDDGYRVYFERGGKRRTLDEALQWASTRQSTSMEEVRAVYAKCERLKQREQPETFGAAAAWLDAAAKGGNNLARVEVARGLAAESGVSGSIEIANRRVEAKRLLGEALRSNDPAVIWEIGDFAMLLVGNAQKASTEQWVWRVAACQRGYDCSPGAEWLKMSCRFDTNCQPYESGLDYIRRNNADSFDEIEKKAIELNLKLDAGQFDDLGI